MKKNIIKTTAGCCPKCHRPNKQIVEGRYPMYDRFEDTITKYFICEGCLTEYYEKFNLEYAGCEVIELTENGYGAVTYDALGTEVK